MDITTIWYGYLRRVAILVIAFSIISPVKSDVTYDSHSASQQEDMGLSATWAHTCSGASILILFTVRDVWMAPTNLSVITDDNGGAYTEGPSLGDGTTGICIKTYYLLNPADGVHNITAVTGSDYAEYRNGLWRSVSLKGVDTSDPMSLAFGNKGASATSATSDSVTTTSGQVILDCLGTTAGSSYSQSQDLGMTDGSYHIRCSAWLNGGTDHAMAWSWTTDSKWGHMGIIFNAASYGPVETPSSNNRSGYIGCSSTGIGDCVTGDTIQ